MSMTLIYVSKMNIDQWLTASKSL